MSTVNNNVPPSPQQQDNLARMEKTQAESQAFQTEVLRIQEQGKNNDIIFQFLSAQIKEEKSKSETATRNMVG